MNLNELKENSKDFVKEELVVNGIIKNHKELELSNKELTKMEEEYAKENGYDKVEDFIQDCGKDFLKNEVYKQIVLDI